jgi:hypothetical protein
MTTAQQQAANAERREEHRSKTPGRQSGGSAQYHEAQAAVPLCAPAR